MAELETENIIKFIVGALVVVVVIGGAYLFFKNYIIDFFNNIFGGENSLISFLIS